jgi:hypothetical protein
MTTMTGRIRNAATVALAMACTTTIAACGSGQPDYRAAATSTTAQQARERDDRAGEQAFAALKSQLPWGEWTETRIHETCAVDSSSSFGSPDPHTITCDASRRRQIGFDGDLVGRMREVDTSIRRTGWQPTNTGVEGPIEYYRQFRGRPEGQHAYGAGDLPGVGYDRPELPEAAGCITATLGIGVSWSEQLVPAVEGSLREAQSSVFERTSGPAPYATMTSLLARHDYVMVLTTSTSCTRKA